MIESRSKTQSENTPLEKVNEAEWDLRAVHFDEKRYSILRFFQKRLIKKLDLREGQNVLDIGCGTGWAVFHMADIIKEEGRAYGIDLSSKMIEMAKMKSSNYTNVYFFKVPARRLPFEENYFDLMISTNAFHHFSEPKKVLEEVYRVLVPGGKIFIVDLTADSFIMRMVDKRIKKMDPGHVKFYSTKEFQELFEQSNLKHEKSKRFMWPMKVHIAEK
jgi:ubiquinone/menaquinone biosynthesis C-methylase UbiE